MAAAKGVAFAAPSADCSDEMTIADTSLYFYANNAHSVYAGLVSHMNADITAPYCGLVQDFTVHHASQVGVQSLYYFSRIVAQKLTVVDCQVGVEFGLANGDNPEGYIHFKDSLVIGSHASSVDCEHKSEMTGSMKIGMMTSPAYASTLELPYSYPTASFHKIGLQASRGKYTIVENVVFKHYNRRACPVGEIPRVINLHNDSEDLVMKHIFKDLVLDDVNQANLLYLTDPDPEQVSLKQCGDFECTGQENVLFEFQGTITQQNNQEFKHPDTPFTVVSNNELIVDDSCTLNSDWNAYICTSTNWGLLEFESQDQDKYDRSIQPVMVTSEDLKGFNNKLNSFMQRASAGFYVDQRRLSRFGSLVRTNMDGFTYVKYTGTPPQRQVFELHGADKDDYMKVSIDYTRPEMIQVLKDGKKVEPNEIIQGEGIMMPLQGDSCGENRWDPVNAILEFTIKGGVGECNLEL